MIAGQAAEEGIRFRKTETCPEALADYFFAEAFGRVW
jgi:hypothetical protein